LSTGCNKYAAVSSAEECGRKKTVYLGPALAPAPPDDCFQFVRHSGIDRTILANPETITADVITDASLFLVSKPNANVNGLAIDWGDSWDADF
jgi:hypothetical protein